MKIFLIATRLIVFILLFGLALANTQESQLNIFNYAVWQAPMIVIGFAFFMAGLGVSALFIIPTRLQSQLEITLLKRRLRQQEKEQAISSNTSP